MLLLSSVLPVTNLFGKVLKFATNIEGELDEWEGGRGGESVYTVSKKLPLSRTSVPIMSSHV